MQTGSGCIAFEGGGWWRAGLGGRHQLYLSGANSCVVLSMFVARSLGLFVPLDVVDGRRIPDTSSCVDDELESRSTSGCAWPQTERIISQVVQRARTNARADRVFAVRRQAILAGAAMDGINEV